MPDAPLFESNDNDALASKSAAKREMEAYRKLGKQLLELAPARLAEIPLSEELREALGLASRLKQREAYRRQLRYIGKLISRDNPEAILEAWAGFAEKDRLSRQHFHRLETLRDKLLAEGDPAVESLLGKFHDLDRQHLRQLVRQGRKELAQGQPPSSSRKLFRYLRDNMPDDNVAS